MSWTKFRPEDRRDRVPEGITAHGSCWEWEDEFHYIIMWELGATKIGIYTDGGDLIEEMPPRALIELGKLLEDLR